METVISSISPSLSKPGVEGCGEGVEYCNRYFFYRIGKHIPKGKVAALKWEGNWSGRQHGEVEYILVAWNGKSFTVLSNFSSNVNQEIAKFKNLTPQQAIQKVIDEESQIQKEFDFLPKCKCGNPLILLYDEQRGNECCDCFGKRTKVKS